MRKMQSYLILSCCAVLFPFYSFAQANFVTGIVKDAVTGQPLAFCSVVLQNSKTGTTSTTAGKFRLALPASASAPVLIISSSGYASDTIRVNSTITYYEALLKPAEEILGGVVVTGVSKATLARENPVPVMLVSTRQIEQATENNIIDILVKNVPGLNAVKTGPNISKPFIRGLGYNRVLTLYDGVRQEGQQWGDEHSIEADAYTIEKADVIKGPSSLMYGSDALAGVINLLPRLPSNTNGKLQGKYISEYQHNNGLLGNGLRLEYADNRWAFILRGSYRIAKNYTNAVDGRVYNTGFRETNASAGIKYNSRNGYSTLNLTLYNDLQGIPDGSRDSLSRRFTQQVNEGIADDIKHRPVVPGALLNAYTLSPLHQHIQHYRIYSNNHYRLGKSDMDVLLALQQNNRREYNHPTLPQQAGMFVRLNTFNYSLRYNAPTVFNTEFTIGINGMYQNNKNKNATDFPIPDYNLFDAGSYIYAKWKKANWTISGGVRYDARYLSGNDFYTAVNPASGFNKQVFLPDTAGAYLQFKSFRATFNGISLSIGSTYRINEHTVLKANMARGYRAPNITEFASNGLDPGAHIVYLGNRDFVPEFSLQEDIGIDLTFRDFSANAAIFNNTISGYIYLAQLTDAGGNALLDAQGNKTYQYLQAAAQLYGMETFLHFHPSFLKGFSFDNSFSVIYGYNRKKEYKNQGKEGEWLPLIPPLKVVSSISRDLKTKSKLLPVVRLKAEADMNAAQNRFLALNDTETGTPAYTLVAVSAGTEVSYASGKALQLQLQVNNLFDKSYQSNLSRLKYFEYYSQSPAGHYGMYNMGRNICVKLVLPF